LISEGDVARSLPAGTLSLAGTEPDCTIVRQDVEYRCVLARLPVAELGGHRVALLHRRGGCPAADHQPPDFLGEYAPAPGVG
jgi:hypothetical protein